MFNRQDSLFVWLLKTGWLRFFMFFFIVCGFDCVDIFHGTGCVVFASSGLFLVAEDRDDSSDCRDFHVEVSLVDDCRELDDVVVAEDGIVWAGYVYHIESYEPCSLGVTFSKGHIQLYFAEGFDSLPPKADEWVLRLVQVLLCQAHLDEALPSENVCGAAIIDEDPTNIVSREVYIISANVWTDNKGSLCG